MSRFVLIVAGGKGLRMGGDLPKQFIPMRGKPVLMRTLEAFHRWDASARLVLVLPKDHQPYWEMLCKEIGCKVPHGIAEGGETRFHSVRNGLDFLSEEIRISSVGGGKAWVGIHDGVRPFVSASMIEACFAEAGREGAAIPVVPLVDSLREVDGDNSFPVDRSRYVAVQTPQVFEWGLLASAYERSYDPLFTDDASVVEAYGHPVRLVPGNKENIKITTPFDLLIAEALLEGKEV